MCGLLGFIYKGSNGFCGNDRDLVEDLLYIDALRGEDSVGVGAFYNDGEMELLKKAEVHVMDFMKDIKYSLLRSSLVSKGKAVLGHNRKATKGTVKDENAHPWLIDNRYLFMHNGTLYSHKHLADTDVDSEALGMHLTKCNGDKEALEEALSHVHGAYACIWIDQEKEKLYILKNKERPLTLAFSPFGTVIASEPGFIVAAAARNSTKITSMEDVENETLYEFDLSKTTDECVIPLKTKLEVKKVSAKYKHTPTEVLGRHNQKGSGVPSSTVYRGKGVTTDNIFFRGAATKNSFKKFKRQFLGRRVDFYIDDYNSTSTVPLNPTEVGRWLMMGEIFAIEPNHAVYWIIDDKFEHEALEMTDRMYSGNIYNITWNPTHNMFNIYVEKVQRASYYEESNKEITTTVH